MIGPTLSVSASTPPVTSLDDTGSSPTCPEIKTWLAAATA